ncbi:hypothetical protein NXX56_08610 [Bacteroides thetaiotaomicron]|nr:hypothetical protein [Bacteroides thetaiotaomicron]MCS2591311.1 hypothetical protein [Bacteroides thetaiotaomicron]
MFKEIADYLLNIDKEKASGLLVGNVGVSLFYIRFTEKPGKQSLRKRLI